MKELLPMGWEETPPVEIPSDKGTPEDEWDSTARPQRPRKAIKAWSRGDRYVRICEIAGTFDDAKPYYVHHGRFDQEDSDAWDLGTDNIDAAILHAKILMRQGGYPK